MSFALRAQFDDVLAGDPAPGGIGRQVLGDRVCEGDVESHVAGREVRLGGGSRQVEESDLPVGTRRRPLHVRRVLRHPTPLERPAEEVLELQARRLVQLNGVDLVRQTLEQSKELEEFLACPVRHPLDGVRPSTRLVR
jgi:hypothetical protein